MVCTNFNNFDPLVRSLGECFSSSESLNQSLLITEEQSNTSDGIQVNVEETEEFYRLLFELENPSVENALTNAFTSLGSSVEIDLRTKGNNEGDDYLNQFIIFFLNPNLQGPEYFTFALPAVIRAASHIPMPLQITLIKIWSSIGSDRLKHVVDVLNQFITLRILTNNSDVFHEDVDIVAAVKCMRLTFLASVFGGSFEKVPSFTGASNTTIPGLYSTDELTSQLNLDILGCREPLISSDDFVNEILNEKLDMSRDFTNYIYGEPKFSFLNYPFLLNAANKSLGLYYDNRVRMSSERRSTAILTILLGSLEGIGSPYLRLKVRRDHLIEDALIRVCVLLF